MKVTDAVLFDAGKLTGRNDLEKKTRGALKRLLRTWYHVLLHTWCRKRVILVTYGHVMDSRGISSRAVFRKT